MRDPARIPVILERLRRVWETHPDLRLGQLLSAAADHARGPDIFYVEDAVLLRQAEALVGLEPSRENGP